MARTSWLFVLLAFVSLAYAARSPVCLASGSTIYKPLQLYPSDCPNNASNCMAAVYNYNAKAFKSNGPATLMPKARESLVYMTQDESDNLDVVVITATTYKDNVIRTTVEVDGAASGSTPLVRDDPTEDSWTWDSATNRGNFSWLLQPLYTDGVVLGHFKLIDNYCFRVAFKPNWNGAIANVVFLSGNVSKPTRVVSRPITATSGFFEFCSYPQAIISHNDVTCRSRGSATAMALNGTATYLWVKNGETGIVGTTGSISNLDAGTYTVTVTVNGCTATRDVVVKSVGSPITVTSATEAQTKTKMGKITITLSGGYTPYSITWRNSMGNVVANNVSSVNVAAGSYEVTITDGCSIETRTIVVDGPAACPPGTYVDVDNCSPCLAGTYSNTYDAPRCTACAAGTRNAQSWSTNCTSCPANTRNNGGSEMCMNCGENMVSAAGSGVCKDCPLGSTRSTSENSCVPCAAGSYRCAASGSCVSCPAGTFSSAGASSCEMCAPGTFSTMGSTACSSCVENTYAAAGASSCTSCESGLQAPAMSSARMSCMAM